MDDIFSVERYLKQFVDEKNLAGVVKGFVGETLEDRAREKRRQEVDVLGQYVDELGIAHIISGYKKQMEEASLPRKTQFTDPNWRTSANFEEIETSDIDWDVIFEDEDIYKDESLRNLINENRERFDMDSVIPEHETITFLIDRDPDVWLPYIREQSQLKDKNYFETQVNNIDDREDALLFVELLNNVDVDFNQTEMKLMFENDEIVEYIVENEPAWGGAVNTLDNYIRTSNPDNLPSLYINRNDIMRTIAPSMDTDIVENWAIEFPEIFNNDFVEKTSWISDNDNILFTVLNTITEEEGNDYLDSFSQSFVEEHRGTFENVFGEDLVASVVEE